jgi:hypothetical protein
MILNNIRTTIAYRSVDSLMKKVISLKRLKKLEPMFLFDTDFLFKKLGLIVLYNFALFHSVF